MAGTIVPWFRQQWLDANGAPLSSGSLETYETGTSTPLATYSDSGLTTSNGTTIVLNSGGFPTVTGVEVGIFLLPRAYRFVLKNSAGVTQRTIDGVYALQAASSVNLEIDGIAGEALSAGEWAYLSDGSAGLTGGRWYKVDADLPYASLHPEIAFVTAAIAIGATGTFRLGGVADALSGLVAGSTYFLSGTAGAITATAPTNARSVGVASSATALALDIEPRWLDPMTQICQGRLTLTTGTPVTRADVSASATLFWAPYTGNRVSLFDGTKWKVYTFAELSITCVGLTASKPYDVFLFDNAGTLTLELLVWTNDTTRATALTKQDGVLVKTGVTTRRYLGTLYTDAAGGAVTDSTTLRHLWNYYNRVPRSMFVIETANSWTYAVATFQQARASAANQLDFVIGVAESLLAAQVSVSWGGSAANLDAVVAIGLDSTTTPATGCIRGEGNSIAGGEFSPPLTSSLRTLPTEGRHTAVWLEWVEAATVTFYGDNGALIMQSGISGEIQG